MCERSEDWSDFMLFFTRSIGETSEMENVFANLALRISGSSEHHRCQQEKFRARQFVFAKREQNRHTVIAETIFDETSIRFTETSFDETVVRLVKIIVWPNDFVRCVVI